MAIKDYSTKQEHMIADYLGWDVVSGSGARPCHPGDIISDDWLGECKTHEQRGKPIFFSQSVWEKIVEEATKTHRTPVLFTDDGSQKSENTWCIFNEFMVDDSWDKQDYEKKFNQNITIKLEDLKQLYPPNTDIENPFAYIVSFGKHRVALLPLQYFYSMFF